jgi:Integrase core domain
MIVCDLTHLDVPPSDWYIGRGISSWFQNLFDARRKIAARKDYNEERPHGSLGYRTPKEFAAHTPGFYRI